MSAAETYRGMAGRSGKSSTTRISVAARITRILELVLQLRAGDLLHAAVGNADAAANPVLGNLLAELLLAWVDPRISYA